MVLTTTEKSPFHRFAKLAGSGLTLFSRLNNICLDLTYFAGPCQLGNSVVGGYFEKNLPIFCVRLRDVAKEIFVKIQHRIIVLSQPLLEFYNKYILERFGRVYFLSGVTSDCSHIKNKHYFIGTD